MNVARWVGGWAGHRPDALALHFEGEDVTYAELAARVRRLARGLAASGLGRGDRVAYLGYNTPEQLVALFACSDLGAVFVPLNWRLAASEHAFILADAEVSLVLVGPEFAAPAGPLRERFPGVRWFGLGAPPAGLAPYAELLEAGGDAPSAGAGRLGDPLLLMYTAGTTGRPKGAVLTQAAVAWNAVNAVHAHDLTSADHVLTDLPLFHVGGLNIQTLPALHAGARVTLHRRFDPGRALADIAARRPTLYLMVPATGLALVDHPDWPGADLGSLRLVMTGSSAVPHALIDAFHDRGVPVGQVYGCTETAPIAVYLRAEQARARTGSCGKAAIHCEVRVVTRGGRDAAAGERGEICVRGPSVMREYWRNPQASAEALVEGWFHTGDVGHFDEAGFLYVDDRLDDVIDSGAEQIYPAELENVLYDSPQIAEAAVVGCPHPRWGEVPVAVVVPKPGVRMTVAEVERLFEGRLARFKHPRRVLFRASLPRNAMGKVLRYRLRADLGPEGGGGEPVPPARSGGDG